ncbi:MAG: hypothetical protein ABI091_10015, partial [Ferruginibacter sp.]
SNLAIHAICSLFGVSYDETPCLIISDNLRFGNFCKVSTGINQLEKQLITLRRVADARSKYDTACSLSDLLNTFDGPQSNLNNVESLEIFPNTIPTVAKVLQIISNDRIFINDDEEELFRDLNSLEKGVDVKEYERRKEVLGLLRTINKRRDYFPNSQTQTTQKFINTVEEQDSTVLEDKEPTISEKLLGNWNNVQPSTSNYLQAACFIEKNMMSLFKSQNDFSIYALPLCKSFETEITYSAVQLIRKYLGVNMPEYFTKYCPLFDNLPITPLASLVNNPRSIYFNNKRSDGKCISPAIGESRLAFATLNMISKEFSKDWQSAEKTDLLLKHWEIIQKVRNKSAHMEQVTGQDKDRLEGGLNELHTANLLNALTSLKMSLNH